MYTYIKIHRFTINLCSVQFSRSVVSDSSWPNGLQHTRPPCPSPTHLLKLMSIESVMPSNHLILCRPLLLPPSINIRIFSNESTLFIRWPNIGASALTSILPMNSQGWSPLGLTVLISLLSKGHSRVFPSTTVQKQQFVSAQPSLWSNCHIHTWLLEKP